MRLLGHINDAKFSRRLKSSSGFILGFIVHGSDRDGMRKSIVFRRTGVVFEGRFQYLLVDLI